MYAHSSIGLFMKSVPTTTVHSRYTCMCLITYGYGPFWQCSTSA